MVFILIVIVALSFSAYIWYSDVLYSVVNPEAFKLISDIKKLSNDAFHRTDKTDLWKSYLVEVPGYPVGVLVSYFNGSDHVMIYPGSSASPFTSKEVYYKLRKQLRA